MGAAFGGKRGWSCVGKAFFTLWAIMLAENLAVRSVLTPFLFAALFLFYRYAAAGTPARALPLCVAAALYAAMTALAVYEQAAAPFSSRAFRLGVLLLLLTGVWLFADHLLAVLAMSAARIRTAGCLLHRECPRRTGGAVFAQKAESAAAFFRRHSFWLSFLICFLCYLPWFLYSWPGIFSPDPINQIEQVLGVEPPSNHHPIAHTVLIGLWMRVGSLFTPDISAQAACYTFFQMTLFAFAAAAVVHTLAEELKLRTLVCLAALGFYALLPFVPVFSIMVCKDTPFTAFVMLFCCVLARILRRGLPDCTGRGILRGAAFVLTGVLLSLFRTNGWYAFLLFSVAFLYLYRKAWKRALLLVLPVIAAVVVIKGPIMDAYHVKQPDLAEALHIPMQQVAQVLVNRRALTQEEQALVEAVIDTTWVETLYVPGYADNIKELIRAGHPEVLEAHRAAYLGLWLRLGLRYPGDYLSAWGAQIRGVIWPGLVYDVATIEGVYPNGLGLEYRPVIGGRALVKLRELALKLGGFAPLYGLLWSAGFYTWLLLCALALILSQGAERRRALLLMPALATLCTLLIATPIAEEFRYAYPCVMLAPFWLCALCGEEPPRADALRSIE